MLLKKIRIIIIDPPINNSISFYLGLVLKYDGRFKKIYHLLYLYHFLVNDYIVTEYLTILYSSLKNILTKIITAEKHFILVKWDIKDVFCNILIALHI